MLSWLMFVWINMEQEAMLAKGTSTRQEVRAHFTLLRSTTEQNLETPKSTDQAVVWLYNTEEEETSKPWT